MIFNLYGKVAFNSKDVRERVVGTVSLVILNSGWTISDVMLIYPEETRTKREDVKASEIAQISSSKRLYDMRTYEWPLSQKDSCFIGVQKP